MLVDFMMDGFLVEVFLGEKGEVFYRKTSEDGEDQMWCNKQGQLHRIGEPAVRNKDGSILEWWINGVRHRDGGPAVIGPDGAEIWYKDGLVHRDDGPASTNYQGCKSWYKEGLPHRIGGPAVEGPEGEQHWYVEGKRHREGGEPAAIFANGMKAWFINDQFHREDGPALISADTQEWYLNGKKQPAPEKPLPETAS